MNHFPISSVAQLALLLGPALVIGCGSSAEEVAPVSGEDAVVASRSYAQLAGDWEGDIVVDGPHVDHTVLRVESTGAAQAIALARGSVLPEDTALTAKLSGPLGQLKVALDNRSAAFNVALAPDGSLGGSVAIGTNKYPVTFRRVARPKSINVKIVASECSGLKSVLIGHDAAIEGAYNAKVDTMVAAHCKTITTSTPSETVTRKPYLVASVYASTPDFLSMDITDADEATFSGPVLATHTYDKSGAEIDLSKSFIATQATYDQLIQVYVDENGFNFTGGEGASDPGPGPAMDAARRTIKLDNGKLTVDGHLFSYSGSTDVNGFMLADAHGLLATLPFRRLASLGVIDPASAVGKYLAANPQAAR